MAEASSQHRLENALVSETLTIFKALVAQRPFPTMDVEALYTAWEECILKRYGPCTNDFFRAPLTTTMIILRE